MPASLCYTNDSKTDPVLKESKHKELRIMRKKLWIFVLSIVLATSNLFLLSACGNRGNQDGTDTLLVDMHSYMPTKNTTPTPESPVVVQASRVIAEAYQERTGVTIKWADSKPTNGSTTEVSEWFTNQISGNRCPAIGFSWGTRFQERDYYVDLTPYLEQPNPYVPGNTRWADLFEDYLWDCYEISDASGRVVAIPITLNPGSASGIYYNKDLFDQLGLSIPKTWKEYESVFNSLTVQYPLTPWTNFKSVGLDQWVFEYSLSPAYAKKIKSQVDTDGDGVVSGVEELSAVKNNLYNPLRSSAAADLYYRAKEYYQDWLPTGWTTTDYTDRWNSGVVGMQENGLWNFQTESNNTKRNFDFGVFAAPILDNTTTDFAAEMERVSIEECKPTPSLMLNVMKPAVEGNPELLEQAVDFLMWLTVPDNISTIVTEHGGSIGAVKGTASSPLLSDWLAQDFPVLSDCRWPLGFTTQYTSEINRKFAEWVADSITDDEFFTALNNAQQNGASDVARALGIAL